MPRWIAAAAATFFAICSIGVFIYDVAQPLYRLFSGSFSLGQALTFALGIVGAPGLAYFAWLAVRGTSKPRVLDEVAPVGEDSRPETTMYQGNQPERLR